MGKVYLEKRLPLARAMDYLRRARRDGVDGYAVRPEAL